MDEETNMNTRDHDHLHDDHHHTGSGDEHVTPGKLAAEGVGGASAGAAGAAIGAMAGPIGMLVGGLAGIVGGWWAGKSAVEAAHHYSPEDDNAYRSAYESSSTRIADRSYDDVRPAYQLGHVAGRNPDYQGRDWDAVEGDLKRGWTDDLRARHGEWETARPFARDAYTRSSGAAGSTAAGLGSAAASAGSSATNAVRDAGHKTANMLDDMKDRVDGNPASRPGPDATDRPERSS